MAQSLKKFDFDVVPAIAREVVQVDSGSIDDVIKAFLGDIPKDVITSYQTGGRNVLPKINWKLVRTTFSKIVATKRDAVAKSIYCEQQREFLLSILILTLSDSNSGSQCQPHD